MGFMRQKLKKEHKKAAATYLLENGSDLHDALSTPAIYNEDRDTFEPLPATRDLEESLATYNESVESNFRFDVKTCTFDDVVSELDRARATYEGKAEGVLGIGRKALRGAGNYSNEITPWIDLVPSDHGLSFLSAGLKIIFGVRFFPFLSIARRNTENSAKILDAFADIPELMLSVKARQNQWASAKALRESAIELYEVLARALAKLIVILNGSMDNAPRLTERARRCIRRVVGSGNTANSIDAILGEVQKQAKRFDQCLDLVRNQLAIQTAIDAAATKTIAGRIETKLDKVKQEIKDANAEMINDLQSREQGVFILNVMHQNLVYINPYCPPEITSSMVPSTSKRAEPLLSDIELLSSLGISSQLPSNDLRTIIKELSRFEISAQTQAQQLFASRQFAEWMASHHPVTLMVNGNFDTPGPGRTTALSVLCAMFALKLLDNNDDCIVLHHFCGLHGARYHSDPAAGPNGLIRSLLAQMLHTGREFNLDFINTPQFTDDIQTHSLKMLCHTFSQLVEQLPRNITIICILDGVSEFASQQWSTEFSDVLLILNRLITSPALRPIFKLLCTTPFSAGGPLIDRQLKVHYSLRLQPSGVHDGYAFSERSLLDVTSQGARLDHFRMRMLANRANEEDDSESDDDDFDYTVRYQTMN
ncbi:uncharacterized protein KD926_006441 [Aspergillus affinis]|uniref:uncharacterized protein n=1 Tax=Aspergillus affinis TaxID=1070780 RepID=UPI0022FE6325|nr:uncharacterized protein KD926_006441 [Aspergillus affinis]KAI9041895.1 hypothetical protein KD926_006441 [Aspergillus affinis]